MTLTEQQIADGWKPHDGGPCPYRATLAAPVLCANGVQTARTVYHETWLWEDVTPSGFDIIAYREVLP